MTKLAILGYGFMGKMHAEAAAAVPGATIAAIATSRQDASLASVAPGAKIFADPFEAIRQSDADAVSICLPTFLHEQAVSLAAKRGLQILCEKPLALTTTAVDRMFEAAEATGVILMTAQVLRFFEPYLQVKARVQRGDVGEVFYVYAQRFSERPRWNPWFNDAEKSGGALFDLHVHDIDYLLALFGAPQSVVARGIRGPAGAWDQVASILSYPGRTVVSEGSCLMPEGWPFTTSLRVAGSKGCLQYDFRVDGNAEKLKSAEHTLVFYPADGPAEKIEVDASNPYQRQMEYFLDCVARGAKPEAVPPGQTRDGIAVLEAAHCSLETGLPVFLG